MSGDTIVAVVAIMACLVLATRSFRAKRIGGRQTLTMAAIWIAIIAALAIVLQRFAA